MLGTVEVIQSSTSWSQKQTYNERNDVRMELFVLVNFSDLSFREIEEIFLKKILLLGFSLLLLETNIIGVVDIRVNIERV
jgi:hypothetical protein